MDIYPGWRLKRLMSLERVPLIPEVWVNRHQEERVQFFNVGSNGEELYSIEAVVQVCECERLSMFQTWCFL